MENSQGAAKTAMGLRELARQIGVDAGNLQRDLKPLKDFGIVVEKDNQLTVPYEQMLHD